MKKSKKKRKGLDGSSIRCPYCGSHTILRSADGIYRDNSRNIMLYVCARYPGCDAYVRTHAGTKIPVGSLANGELRALRTEAHRAFDKLYKTGIMSKQEAYQWLADVVAAPLSHAHIGYLSDYYCKVVIRESQKYLRNATTRKKQIYKEENQGGVLAS